MTTNDSPSPRTILVVDDDAHMRRLIELSLAMDGGWAVTAVESGAAALAAFEREPFAVVLLDAQMPGLDGEQTLARLLTLPGANETRFVMLSGHEGAALARLEALPVAAVLTKPIIPQALGPRLREIAAS